MKNIRAIVNREIDNARRINARLLETDFNYAIEIEEYEEGYELEKEFYYTIRKMGEMIRQLKQLEEMINTIIKEEQDGE